MYRQFLNETNALAANIIELSLTETSKNEIIKKAKKAANSDYINCRLFTQLVTNIPKIEKQPRLDTPEIGAILWWGNGNNYRHCAVALDKDTLIQVPEWGGKSEILKIKQVEKEYGPIDRIYKGK